MLDASPLDPGRELTAKFLWPLQSDLAAKDVIVRAEKGFVRLRVLPGLVYLQASVAEMTSRRRG